MYDKPLNTVLIGCGGRGISHLAAIQDFDDIHIIGVCDPVAELRTSTAEKFNAPNQYGTIDALLNNQDIDLAIVSTPAHINAECAYQVIKKGIHTLLEKPPGLSASDTIRLRDAARESDAKVLVGWNRRFHSTVLKAREMIEERGPIVQIVAEFHKSMTRLTERHWPEQLKDNFIYETPIHAIDLTRALAGSAIAEIHPIVRRAYSKHVDIHAALILFESGCVAQFTANYTTDARLERYEIHGQDCSAYLEGIQEGIVYRDGERLIIANKEDGTAAQARFLIDCIKEDRPVSLPAANLDEAIETMKLADTIRGSLRS